ncbi:MAG: SpoIID/LytB domain-containing protein [Candidatus Daviesbacteria bacterium]|nr:SpoIID/LytB domain-containing protein [Candidatus Daviesbacteria bacterium]
MLCFKKAFSHQSLAVRSILIVCLLITSCFLLITLTHADEIEDLQKQINELNKAREQSVAATKPLEGQLDSLKIQLAQLQAKLNNLSATITQKEKDLKLREDKLVIQQALLSSRVRSYYIHSYFTTPLIVILSSSSSGDLFRELSYKQAATREDQRIISSVTSEMLDLLIQKEKLEKDKASLASLQSQVDQNAKFIGGEVSKAKAYQADLSNKIAALSAKQQQLLAQKLGSLNLPKSAYSMRGGCTDDRNIDPGFSPRFAMFTYGVPNRVGLSQFGAWGRAKAGQNEDAILHAYYNFDNYQNVDTGISIKVNDSNGFNSGNVIWSGSLEDYIKRIYEVPDSWTDNNLAVLKAQAIAARSYVLAATNNGANSICANQYCQAFQTNPKGGNWETAANATSGKVMIQGGQTVKAWFSSTHGGYIFNSGDIGWSNTSWTKRAVDTTSGSAGSFSDLQNTAYEKDSPIFYCDWGARAQYNKTAWLKSEEMADIVNVLMLAKKDSGTQEHLSQIDKPNPDGKETWDAERVKRELGSKAFNNISDISVSVDFGAGRTTTVTVSGDGKSESFGGSEFKDYFNLRAPSNINIVGPLFNVEKK